MPASAASSGSGGGASAQAARPRAAADASSTRPQPSRTSTSHGPSGRGRTRRRRVGEPARRCAAAVAGSAATRLASGVHGDGRDRRARPRARAADPRRRRAARNSDRQREDQRPAPGTMKPARRRSPRPGPATRQAQKIASWVEAGPGSRLQAATRVLELAAVEPAPLARRRGGGAARCARAARRSRCSRSAPTRARRSAGRRARRRPAGSPPSAWVLGLVPSLAGRVSPLDRPGDRRDYCCLRLAADTAHGAAGKRSPKFTASRSSSSTGIPTTSGSTGRCSTTRGGGSRASRASRRSATPPSTA